MGENANLKLFAFPKDNDEAASQESIHRLKIHLGTISDARCYVSKTPSTTKTPYLRTSEDN